MDSALGPLALFQLGTEVQHVSLVVRGRHSPGELSLHDSLQAEIIVRTEIGTLRLQVVIAPYDIDDWERALDTLAAGLPVSWLGSRLPDIEIGPGDGSGFWQATVSDPGQSGVVVQVPVTVDDAANRDRLAAVRLAYPREVFSPSPGTYQWRSPRTGQ